MQVTLIGTRHKEVGNCTSKGLYHILESLKPEVIFVEVPPKKFDNFYTHKKRSNLESIAIAHYVQNISAKVIPVDSDDIPEEEFLNAYESIHKKVDGLANQHGFNYRTLTDTVRLQTVKHGFEYLNSIYFSNAYEQMNEIIENALEEINSTALFEALILWNRINTERENQMLQNIYMFWENSKFENAVFIIGASHRKSIINKIPLYEENAKVNLSWKF